MPAYCTRCGKALEDGPVCMCVRDSLSFIIMREIRSIYAKTKIKMGFSNAAANPEDLYERGKLIVPDCVQPNSGETPIKQFDVAVLRSRIEFARAEGRLQITDKRVLFRASGKSLLGRTTLQHEFAIEEISGVEMRKDFRFSFADILLISLASSVAIGIILTLLRAVGALIPFLANFYALIIGVLGLVPFFLVRKRFLLKILLCSCSVGAWVFLSFAGTDVNLLDFEPRQGGLALIYMSCISVAGILAFISSILYSIRSNLVLAFKTKGAVGAIEIRRRTRLGPLGILLQRNAAHEEYTGYNEVLPAIETEKAAREIGSIIADLQTLGKYGFDDVT